MFTATELLTIRNEFGKRYHSLVGTVHPNDALSAKIAECDIDPAMGVVSVLEGIVADFFKDRSHDLKELIDKIPAKKIIAVSAGAAMLIILVEAWFDDLMEML